MVAHVRTVAFRGIEALSVEVQVQLSSGLPGFTIVGLADKAVAESRERVRSALTSMGLSLPAKRITVNLAPADLQKEGTHFDLPIALGILLAMDALDRETLSEFLVLGELGLDGRISRVAGVLPAAVHGVRHDLGIICPESCGIEASWAGDITIVAADSLLSLVHHLRGQKRLPLPDISARDSLSYAPLPSLPDLSDIKGQESAKRVLEIAAAGGHNLLMVGPPGAGKSMLASRLPSILPPLSPQEMLDLSMIQSVAGLLHNGELQRHCPFRSPHHTASQAALVGGGVRAGPGEISLAHGGVLFLDELPEFDRAVLESLRQPLENKVVMVARANMRVSYPARFQLVAAMNPCRCGYLGDASAECSRAPKCGEDYMKRLSGPLLDRIDLQIEVPEVKPSDLGLPRAEKSESVRKRVESSRALQRERFIALADRFEGAADIPCNAAADGEVLETIIGSDAYSKALATSERLARKESFRLSARGFHRTLRVARTIADLARSEAILDEHINEAFSYHNRHYRDSEALG